MKFPLVARHPAHYARVGLAAAALLLSAGCAANPQPASGPTATAPVTILPYSTAPASAAPTAAPDTPLAANPTATPRTPLRPTPPAAAEPGEQWTSPADDMTLVFVPGGRFFMGASADFAPAEPDERPQRELVLQAFWIDSTEVTFAMYAQCQAEGGCPEPLMAGGKGATDDHPVAGVTWAQAESYCRWMGRRLPSEAEWEKAARTSDGRRYPWGWIGAPKSGGELRLNFCDGNCPFDYRDDSFDDGFARSAPVASFESGVSPYGAYDLAGNVWEWTADWYRDDAYRAPGAEASGGPSEGAVRSIRGGAWTETTWEGLVLTSRASNRFWHDPERTRPDLGFRCAVDGVSASDQP